jgi:hypothetical protein
MGKASRLSGEGEHASLSSSLGLSWAFSGSVSELNRSWLDGTLAYLIFAVRTIVVLTLITATFVVWNRSDIVIVAEHVG